MCLDFPQKRQTHAGLSCNLSLEKVEFLGLDSLRSTLIFLGGVTYIGLTTSLTRGSEEETKFVEWVLGTEVLSTKPKPVLSKGDFWILSMWSSLELADLFVYSLATDKSSSKFLTLSSKSKFSVFTLFNNSLASNSFKSKIFLSSSRDAIFFKPKSTLIASFAATLKNLL